MRDEAPSIKRSENLDDRVTAGSFFPAQEIVGTGAAQVRWLPDSIGKYRILRLLGEGGMGSVYEAQQEQPRRTVALKVIKPGLRSSALLRRFEQESQALGRLQHPGIAQIYEASTADTGFGPQPYFAMEFIRGQSLRDYAETHHLNTRQRMEIMSKVCDAVHHAHQRGLIHRDLKPGNILVDETGQPKILDFGVARVTDSDVEATLQTVTGQIVGTLAYMSPEQVTADPLEIDTRSDIYALGVILYELLAERLPYSISAKLHEAVQTIRDQDPSPLSAISRIYRGDIETIVAKALEKDKVRRYASAAELASDIRRHLSDQPITARPPSVSYQLQKFARRHKALVAAIAAVFVVLLAGIVASTWLAVRASRAEQAALRAQRGATEQRDRALKSEQAANSSERRAVEERNNALAEKQRADTEAATAKAVSDFLQNDLLAQADSSTQAEAKVKPDPDLKVRTALDRAAARVAGKFDNQPLVEASIRQTIGETYAGLGAFDEAVRQEERAYQLRRRVLGEENPDTLASLNKLGRYYSNIGKYAEAESLLIKVLERQARVLGSEADGTLLSMNALSTMYERQGKYAQAEALTTKVREILRRKGDQHASDSTQTLAILYADQGKYAQAEALIAENLEIWRRTLGEEHPDTLISLNDLGRVYLYQGKYVKAEQVFSKGLEISRRVLGEDHVNTLTSQMNLALVYYNEGEYSQAEPLYIKTLDGFRRVMGEEHFVTLNMMNNLALLYKAQGRYAQAEPILTRTLEIRRRVLGEDDRFTPYTMLQLGSVYLAQGKYAQAEPLYTKALDVRRRTLGEQAIETLDSMTGLADLYVEQEKYTEAGELYAKVLEVRRRVQGEEHPSTLDAQSDLAILYKRQGQYAQASVLYTKVLEARRRVLGPQHRSTTSTLAGFGELRLLEQRYSEAQPLLREAASNYEKTDQDGWSRFNTQSLLGASLAGQKKYAEAEPLLVSGCEGMLQREASIPAGSRPDLERAEARLVQFYEDWEKPEKAAEWRDKLGKSPQTR